MNDAVFISDLHLHPNRPDLTTRFFQWINWALKNTRSVYILGDFFHAWAGDDTFDTWSLAVAERLAEFDLQKIPVYFMVGNRDFLLGQRFADLAKLRLIQEPYVLQLDHHRVLLVHGDRYCTLDRRHQWFRKLTRNHVFQRFFLALPRSFRKAMVYEVRKQSQYRTLSVEEMATFPAALGMDAVRYDAEIIIHGHTHVPLRVRHRYQARGFEQIVLSDWEETVLILCYNKGRDFFYNVFDEENAHACAYHTSSSTGDCENRA